MSWTLDRFKQEMKKIDPLLRIRVSTVSPSMFIIERKCTRESAVRILPRFRRGMDKWIRDKEGYTDVTRVKREDLDQGVLHFLRLHDMQGRGGANRYADKLALQERVQEEAVEKEQSAKLQAMGEEAYDRGRLNPQVSVDLKFPVSDKRRVHA